MAGFTFRTTAVAGSDEAASTVLVVHCSDARYQPHFQAFLRDGLHIDRYGLVAVPGGPHFLTLVDYLPKFSWVGWRWMKFLVDLLHPRRIVVIGHDDCRWYKDGRFLLGHGQGNQRQLDDLHRVRAAIAERFESVSVEAYFARLEGDQALFEGVA